MLQSKGLRLACRFLMVRGSEVFEVRRLIGRTHWGLYFVTLATFWTRLQFTGSAPSERPTGSQRSSPAASPRPVWGSCGQHLSGHCCPGCKVCWGRPRHSHHAFPVIHNKCQTMVPCRHFIALFQILVSLASSQHF